MKYIPPILLLVGICLLGECVQAADQEANAKRSAGIINDSLRSEFPAASAWDIGGQFRLRAEARDAGSFPNRDYIQNRDHGNDHVLFRNKLHIAGLLQNGSRYISRGVMHTTLETGRPTSKLGCRRTSCFGCSLIRHQLKATNFIQAIQPVRNKWTGM